MTATGDLHTTAPPPTQRWSWLDWTSIATLILAAIGITWRLWEPGIPNRADMLMGIYRVFELASAWREGIWYPRLGPHLNFTYGAPLFQFYPPLVSYLALFLTGFGAGFVAASKAVLVLAVVGAGCGMYVLARSIFTSRSAAWLSAALYLSAPYLLLDVYERGAAAESVALALLPWLLWSLRTLFYQPNRRHWLIAALLVALFMLTHNITALFVMPAAVIYLLLLAAYARNARPLLWVAAALLLGLALSAFYWLPAVSEVHFTHAEEYMLGAQSDVTQNLRPWGQIIQSDWAVDYQSDARFRFALRDLLLALIGLLALPFVARQRRYELALFAALCAAMLLLQTQITQPFWQEMPMVRYIQFSWRLFGPASLAAALLAGGALTALSPQRVRWLVAVPLALLAFWPTMQNLHPDQLPYWQHEIDEASITVRDLYERGRRDFPLFGDYSPIFLNTNPGSLPTPRDGGERFPATDPQPTLRLTAANPIRLALAVDAPAPFTLRAHRIFFPGWQIYVDGARVPTQPSGKLGLVTAELPAGTYTATIQFDQTPIRRVGDLVALAALALWIVCALPLSIRWRWLAGAGLWLGLVALTLFWQQSNRLARQPIQLPINFGNELQLLAYDLPSTFWQPGDTLSLRLYWFLPATPEVDYKIFLHVAELDDSGKVAQFDSEPQSGYSAMTRWEAGELVTDEYQLTLEAPVKPGRYQLLMGVYHPETMHNLLVPSAPNVLPGDRVVLTTVEIGDE